MPSTMFHIAIRKIPEESAADAEDRRAVQARRDLFSALSKAAS
ncbi:hypothetical protein [Sorangium sp. So ce394]